MQDHERLPLRPPQLRPIARREYDRMVSLGLFEDERVELINGMVLTMSPQDAPHSFPIQALNILLVRAMGDEALVRVRLPLALSEDSEPEPDLAVVPTGDYRREHPQTAWLVVEVANTSLARDRERGTLYALAGIPEYWLVDVEHQRIERYQAPRDGAYTSLVTLAPGDIIGIARFPAVGLAVADILGVERAG